MATTYNTYSDEQLLPLLRSGDVAAFETIYDRYWKKLFTVAANKLKDLYLAEELVQDLFISLWQRRETIIVTSQLSAYLAAAVKYKVIDASVKQAKTRSHAGELNTNRENIQANDQSFEWENELTQQLHTLPEKCQLIFGLSKISGYSHKEIANHLDISEKTVEYHLSRAVKKLRTGLGNLFTILVALL